MGLFGDAGWPCEKQRGPQTAIGGKTSQMGVAEKVGMRKRKIRYLKRNNISRKLDLGLFVQSINDNHEFLLDLFMKSIRSMTEIPDNIKGEVEPDRKIDILGKYHFNVSDYKKHYDFKNGKS